MAQADPSSSEAPWTPGADFDPVTAQVIRGAMETIAYEIATHVSLTAKTPILNQSNERNASILDGRGRLAAVSVGVPQLMLASRGPVRFALEFFGRDGIREGDVIVANDPYHGGGHLPDYNVFSPVMADGEVLLMASIQCHHADTGGGVAGGYNAEADDIWAEGVRFPVIKVVDAGVERPDVIYTMQTNTRAPTFIGDLRAQIGAAQLGVARMRGIVEQHGAQAVRDAIEFGIRNTRLAVEREVKAWPDGTYEGEALVDRDPMGNTDIRVHAAITVAGERMTVDLSGSDARPEIRAFSPLSNSMGYVIAQIASMIDPTIPKNEGFFDAIEMIIPEGTCVNPPKGATVAAGIHHPGTEVGEAVCKALAPLAPGRACPQVYKIGTPIVTVGNHPETGELFFDHGVDSWAGYTGAVQGVDGWGCYPAGLSNVIRATSEINETIFPFRNETLEYRTDSGGAGQWRGCPGSTQVKRMLSPTAVSTWMVGITYPVPGFAGGHDGSPNRLRLRPDTEGTQIIEDMARAEPLGVGDAYEYQFGGGGGFGDPLDREPQAVCEDVLDELVSLEAAREVYGVVLTGSLDEYDLAVDAEATAAQRARLRAERP